MPRMHENSMNMPVRSTILIVCIGNDIVADDAVGYHLYHALNASGLPPEVKTLYLAVGGINLLDHLDGSEQAIIVVDAVKFGNKPGTIVKSQWNSLQLPVHSPVSIHGIGLREVFEIVPVLYPGKYTDNIFFIGIEGAEFNQCGAGLSPDVANAVEKAILTIHETIELLQEVIQ